MAVVLSFGEYSRPVPHDAIIGCIGEGAMHILGYLK